MSHDHSHNVQNIKSAFFLNVSFTLLELIGGILTNSVAILSDALHDLGDSLSLGLSWWLERFAEKECSERFTYGYRRFSLLGSLINAVVLLTGSIFVMLEAFPRLLSPEKTHSAGMIGLAVVGVAVNGLAVVKLSSGESENIKVLTWHLLEDVLGWTAVLIGGVVIYFTDLYIIDPILSIGITAFILWNVFRRLSSTVSLFLQSTPQSIDITEILDKLTRIDGVNSEHHTHVWSLDGEHHVLTTHLVLNSDLSQPQRRQVKETARQIASNAGFSHVTVELEWEGNDCSMGTTKM